MIHINPICEKLQNKFIIIYEHINVNLLAIKHQKLSSAIFVSKNFLKSCKSGQEKKADF